MEIIRAKEMGMCFGVRDALQITKEITDPTQVTIHGELVHNPSVIQQLSVRGFSQSAESDRQSVPPTQLVLITAHGVSNRERSRLRDAGKQLIDTTCPLVRRVHDAAMSLAAEDRLVLLIGKPGHVEVLGIVEDLERCVVISNEQDVRRYNCQRLGIISQTTMPSKTVKDVNARIVSENPNADIRFVDTVCQPTKRRQQAMQELIDRVDAVVVVGGRNSNNTRRLTELCEHNRLPAWQVTCAEELDPDWFNGFETIGLTAGTSTLDSTIDEVHRRLEQIATAKEQSRCSVSADRTIHSPPSMTAMPRIGLRERS